ncbi:MAG: peptide ABC transporter substrate-binding protein [Oscillospiraceae bacterium]|nr:peptide ABC transporter substrate-binding protein [Oscillospiraceae bacterium]
MSTKMRAVSFLTALIFFICGCGLNKPPKSTLRYDISGSPATLDPQYASRQSELAIINNSFEGLTAISPEGNVIPAAAESWEVSTDKKSYTFTLRDDIKWSNGDSVTADDFVFGLKRLFNPVAFSDAADDYLMIKNASDILSGNKNTQSLGVKALSEKELLIELEYADPSILTLLSRASASPCQKEFFDDQKGKYGLSAKNVICNGPFIVDSWGDDYVVIVKNPQYREKIAIDGVNLYFNRGDSVERFLEAKTDACLIPFYRFGETKGLSGEMFYDQSWLMLFNRQKDILCSTEVRKAFLASFDKGEMLSNIPEYLKPYNGAIAPDAMMGGICYRDEAKLPTAAPLPSDARSAFFEAMEQLERNSMGKLSIIVSDFEPGPNIGGQLLREWQQKLSAYVNMEQLAYQQLIDRTQRGDFDIAIAPLVSQSDSLIDRFRLIEALEPEGDTTLSDMLSAARQQPDTAKSAKLLSKAEQYIIDQYIALPLFCSPSLFSLGEGIEGVYYNDINGTVYFADAICSRD